MSATVPTTGAESGLLEQPALVVRARGDGLHRLLTPGEAPVGYTRRLRRGVWPGGFGATLAVHEQEQQPLVCTVRRRWTWRRRYEVRDAEEEYVGAVTPTAVLDRWDRVMVARRGDALVDGHGQVLARLRRDGGDTRLDLEPVARHDPFAKMLLLAYALVA